MGMFGVLPETIGGLTPVQLMATWRAIPREQ